MLVEAGGAGPTATHQLAYVASIGRITELRNDQPASEIPTLLVRGCVYASPGEPTPTHGGPVEDTLVVLHCYAGDEAQTRSMLNIWTHHNLPLLVLSPENAPVDISYPPMVTSQHAGEAGWKGPHTIKRQIAHWKLAAETGHQWFLLHDSDSVCLSPDIPSYLYTDPGIFWSNVLCHENEHEESDQPNFNPPYFMSRELLLRMIDAAENLELGDGFLEPHDWGQAIDGFYTYIIRFVLDAPWASFPDGATTWPPWKADLLRDAIHGKRMIHGVKAAERLEEIRRGYVAYVSGSVREELSA